MFVHEYFNFSEVALKSEAISAALKHGILKRKRHHGNGNGIRNQMSVIES